MVFAADKISHAVRQAQVLSGMPPRTRRAREPSDVTTDAKWAR
jgi:hypothetical protein